MVLILSVIVSALIAGFLFKIISINGKSLRAIDYARTFAAWVVALATITSLSPFILNPNANAFMAWLAGAFGFGGIAFIFGYLFGKFKENQAKRKADSVITKTSNVQNISRHENIPEVVSKIFDTKVVKQDKNMENTIGDEEFYLTATKEVEDKGLDEALWAKCLTIFKGDEKKAKYDYIEKRVVILRREELARIIEKERMAKVEEEEEIKRIARVEEAERVARVKELNEKGDMIIEVGQDTGGLLKKRGWLLFLALFLIIAYNLITPDNPKTEKKEVVVDSDQSNNKKVLNLENANLEGADLTKEILEGISLKKANLKSANLSNVNLKKANLEGANLKGANLEGANLEGANLEGANLEGTIAMTAASLANPTTCNDGYTSPNSKAYICDSHGGVNIGIYVTGVYHGANLKGANLKGANLEEAILNGTDLSYSNLNGANLSRSKLYYANLKGATLIGADLSYAKLKNANLEDADLSDAYLFSSVDLEKTNLKNVNFQNANLKNVNFQNAILVGVNLSYANLSNANLTGVNLSNANLTGADLAGANLNNTKTDSAIFCNTKTPWGLANSGCSPITSDKPKITESSEKKTLIHKGGVKQPSPKSSIKLQKYEEEINLWKELAEQGNSDAQYNLAQIYRNGGDVLKGDEKSVKWYRKAAEQGNSDAQYNLGVMYDKGTGVLKDYKQAYKWYRKAAEQSHVDAQYNLALMYLEGEGVIKDMTKAKYWTEKAIKQGDEQAQTNWDDFELWKY